MENEKTICQRQERLAQKREQAIKVVHDCEFRLDQIAEQLDRLALHPPAMFGGNLFGLGGRRHRVGRSRLTPLSPKEIK